MDDYALLKHGGDRNPAARLQEAPILIPDLTKEMVSSVTGPLCYYCEAAYEEAPESCPGDSTG